MSAAVFDREKVPSVLHQMYRAEVPLNAKARQLPAGLADLNGRST
jgi:hypothetical protein